MSSGLASSLQSPIVRIVLAVIAAGLLWILWREVRKIPAKLAVLMAAAFIDMVGLLIIVPLLPFYAMKLGGNGVDVWGVHLGIGMIVAILVGAFTVAQLLSAPTWGRFSDRFGRRPALLVALGASAIAYLVFGFANSLWLLFISRIVQGAGGGTVGVIQAYVADATEPENRARALGWLSAATNLGVALGPVVGSLAVTIGDHPIHIGASSYRMGYAAPGIVAAVLCVLNMLFAWKYLKESKDSSELAVTGSHPVKVATSREAVWSVITHFNAPSSRLIWMYAIAIGAFQGTNAILALFLADRFEVTEKTIGYFFMYVGAISVFTRVLLLGQAVDRLGEARLSRIGILVLAVGMGTMPLTHTLPWLALSVALIPLGTAFTFPCVTSMLSRVIPSRERGLYMGLQQTFGGVARVITPLWAGFSYDRLGSGVPFYSAAAVVFATIFLGIGLERHTTAARAPAVSSSS